MRDPVSPADDDSTIAADGATSPGPRAAPPLPPEWAREEPSTTIPTAMPLAIAMLGWVVAAALLIYSHGQADRVRTTQEDMRSRVGALTREVALAQTVQDYLSTPNLKIIPFHSLRPVPANSLVTLILSPKYIHVVVVGRWLAPLQNSQMYAVWAKDYGGAFTAIGTLTQKGPAGEYAAVVAGKHPINDYRDLYLSVENNPAGSKPAGPLLFGARIRVND